MENLKNGNEYLAGGDFENAFNCFKAASEENPYDWEAYWGMFKASVKAVNDSDVHVAGLTEEADEAAQPDYVRYYKRAKELAEQNQVKDINFFEIEQQCIDADRAQKAYLERMEAVKAKYISGEAEEEKGRAAFEKIHEHMEKNEKSLNNKLRNSNASLLISFAIVNVVLGFFSSRAIENNKEGLSLFLLIFGTAISASIFVKYIHSILGINTDILQPKLRGIRKFVVFIASYFFAVIIVAFLLNGFTMFFSRFRFEYLASLVFGLIIDASLPVLVIIFKKKKSEKEDSRVDEIHSLQNDIVDGIMDVNDRAYAENQGEKYGFEKLGREYFADEWYGEKFSGRIVEEFLNEFIKS